MGNPRQAIGARLDFAKGGQASSWRRMNLPTGAGGKRTVAAALEALKSRPGFELSGAAYGDLIELRGTSDVETLAGVTAEVEALVVSAGGKGAHAELEGRAHFEGAVSSGTRVGLRCCGWS